jgi:hypothetical protein
VPAACWTVPGKEARIVMAAQDPRRPPWRARADSHHAPFAFLPPRPGRLQHATITGPSAALRRPGLVLVAAGGRRDVENQPQHPVTRVTAPSLATNTAHVPGPTVPRRSHDRVS